MAGVALPFLVFAVEELVVWLGFGLAVTVTAATVVVLVEKSQLGSKVKQWALDNAERVNEDIKRKDPREETPFTHPTLFKKSSISDVKTKAHEKIGLQPRKDAYPVSPVGSIWCEDWQHCNEFEVYRSAKSFERNVKDRVVFIDGRLNVSKTVACMGDAEFRKLLGKS